MVTTYRRSATSTVITQSHDEHLSVVSSSRWGPAAKLTGSSCRLKRFIPGPVTPYLVDTSVQDFNPSPFSRTYPCMPKHPRPLVPASFSIMGI
jgi:hypothetical protein